MSLHLIDVRSSDQTTVDVSSLTETTASLRLIDRLSLRFALWLIQRSTRRAPELRNREAHTRLVLNERNRSARESAFLREQLLSPRP